MPVQGWDYTKPLNQLMEILYAVEVETNGEMPVLRMQCGNCGKTLDRFQVFEFTGPDGTAIPMPIFAQQVGASPPNVPLNPRNAIKPDQVQSGKVEGRQPTNRQRWTCRKCRREHTLLLPKVAEAALLRCYQTSGRRYLMVGAGPKSTDRGRDL